MSRRQRGNLPAAVAISAALHAGIVGLVWALGLDAEPLPAMRVYAVDIVSPPPRELGEFTPEPPPTPEPVEEPEPEPEPEPVPPEPEPEPEPVPAPPRREPSPQPEPRRTEPTPPRDTPPDPPRETPRPPPSTGANPDANSAGGEGLNVRTAGAEFVDRSYLENIIRQVNRYFRRPAGSVNDEVEIAFVIARDGSVGEISIVRGNGAYRFRAAAMEAVEQAGRNRAFGPLPREYPADRLPVSFYFRPAR